jgi:phosphoenolpyruvate-protein kinase (PTS system EI component)
MDVGADKPLPFMRFLAETNPSLGRRGIRFLREYPELLETHLRAVLELARDFDVRLLIPMVALPDDVAAVRECLSQLGSELQISSLPKLGAMIETPAAALSAREIAEQADFLSFGTNDLTQYAFAADRENAAVERYFDDSADVIFRLLQIVHDDVPDVPLSVCGELAGQPAYAPRLLGCGKNIQRRSTIGSGDQGSHPLTLPPETSPGEVLHLGAFQERSRDEGQESKCGSGDPHFARNGSAAGRGGDSR